MLVRGKSIVPITVRVESAGLGDVGVTINVWGDESGYEQDTKS